MQPWISLIFSATMKPTSLARCRWAVATTVAVVALLITGAILWHRAVFGPWSDAWNLGNNLIVSLVCWPILQLSPFLALLALVLAVRLVRRGRRRLGIFLIMVNTTILITTASAAAWDWRSRYLLSSRQPLTRSQTKWFTPWGWRLESQLHYAIISDDANLVRKCVAGGADVNAPAPQLQWRPAEGETPLETSVNMKSSEMVRLLLELGADAHQGGRNAPVWTVLRSGYLELLQVMYDASVSLPPEAMVFACRESRIELLAWLIDRGWDVNTTLGDSCDTELERHGRPIDIAAAIGNIEVVRFLLKHGADINGTGSNGHFNPIRLASERPDTEMLVFLLAHGADPTARTDHGWNAMHIAAFAGSSEALKILFAHDPTLIESRTHDGESPLWFSSLAYSRPGALSAIRFLLENGADRGVMNRKGLGIVDVLKKDREIVISRGDEKLVQQIDTIIDLL